MTSHTAALSPTVERLRREFDSTFSRAPTTEKTRHLDLLAIRVGTQPYALHLTEISALAVGKVVTPLPLAASALLGITGFRGLIVPVYDLAVLLGHGGGETLRWMVVSAGATTIGLAFDHFDGHLRVEEDELVAEGPGSSSGRLRQVLQHRHEVLPMIQVPAIVEMTTDHMNERPQSKER